MRSLLLALSVVLASFSLEAQNTCKLSKFEKELMEFKYNLYEDLGGYDYHEMQDFSFLRDGKPLRIKVDKFIEDHKKDIRDYQENQLKRYEVFEIDTSAFAMDSLFDEYKNELRNSDDLIAKEVGDFFKINPFVYFNTLQSFIVARKYSAMEIGRKYLKNSIALPKIATKELEKGKWHVFIDEYDMAFLYSFNVETMNCKILGLYERKRLRY